MFSRHSSFSYLDECTQRLHRQRHRILFLLFPFHIAPMVQALLLLLQQRPKALHQPSGRQRPVDGGGVREEPVLFHRDVEMFEGMGV